MAEKVVVDLEFKSGNSGKKASEDIEALKEQLEGVTKELEDIKKGQEGTKKALKGISAGFKGLGLAMKTMGVGLIVEAFNMLKEIIMQNQPIVDALEKGTTALGIVFNQVAEIVVDFGQSIFNAFSQPQKTIDSITDKLIGFKDYIVDKFSGVGTILKGIFSFDMDMIKSGLEEVKGDFEDFRGDVTDVYENVKDVATKTFETIVEKSKEALKSADALVEQRKQVRLLEAEQKLLNFTYLRENEILRQTRDDVTATFEERIEANKKLGESLNKQLEEERAIAQARIDLAQAELETNSTSVELQEALINAKGELADVEERITGQRSEQLTNTNALLLEQQDAINQLRLLGATEREVELEALEQDYQAKLKLAEQSGQDINAVTEFFSKQRNKIEEKYRMQNLDMIASTINMASGLFAEGTAMAKVTGVAQATIDTYKAVNMALASSPPPFSFISAGLTLATGIKNVKEILSVKTEKPANVQAPNAPSIPSGASGQGVANLSSSGFDLQQQFVDNFAQQNPVQAYVVEQEVTDSQQINTMITQKATL